jgi:hypothetical protein
MLTILVFEIKEGKYRTNNKKIVNNNLSLLVVDKRCMLKKVLKLFYCQHTFFSIIDNMWLVIAISFGKPTSFNVL